MAVKPPQHDQPGTQHEVEHLCLLGLREYWDCPGLLACAPGEVHIWRIELDCHASTVASLGAALSSEERQRAARFRSVELQERWTVAHGALRCILASYVRCSPTALAFQEGPHGKPALAIPAANILFNLCHTGKLALLAVSGGMPVGIDAEAVRPVAELEDLSRQFFTSGEAEEILALHPDLRLAAFFSCWSRKEAFVKALGGGLSIPLNCFQVSIHNHEPARLLWVEGKDCNKWSLLDISEPGTAAAIVAQGPITSLRRFSFIPR